MAVPSLLLLLLLLLIWRSAGAIKVLESQVELGDDRRGVAYSMAQLVPRNGSLRAVSDLTICSRMNLKILRGMYGTRLWYVPDPNAKGPKVGAHQLGVTAVTCQFVNHVNY